jgi:hypothetical protein
MADCHCQDPAPALCEAGAGVLMEIAHALGYTGILTLVLIS